MACGDDPEPTGGDASDPGGDPTSTTPPSDPPSSEPAEPTETDTGEPARSRCRSTSWVTRPRVRRSTASSCGWATATRCSRPPRCSPAAACIDPDYRTLLGDLGIESVTAGDDLIDVALTADTTTNDKAVPPELGRLAVQSLVYTLQGTAQSRARVVVTQGGVPVTLYGVDTQGGVRAAPELDVLAHVNLTTPEEGATVSGSFTAEGRASSFEATVPWQIRDGDGKVVQEGFTTAEGWIDKLYPFTAEVDVSKLAPGSYTFVALTDDPSGGEGGGPHEDTRTIVVE